MFNPRDISSTHGGTLLPAAVRTPAHQPRRVVQSIVPPDRSNNATPLAGHRYGPASAPSLRRLSRALVEPVNVGGVSVARIGSVARPFLDGDRHVRNSYLSALEENPAAALPDDAALQTQMLKPLAAHALTPRDYLFGDEQGWVRQNLSKADKLADARSVAARFFALRPDQRRAAEVMLAYVSTFGTQTTLIDDFSVRIGALRVHQDAPHMFPADEDVATLGAKNKAIAQCYRISRFMSALQRAYEYRWIDFDEPEG